MMPKPERTSYGRTQQLPTAKKVTTMKIGYSKKKVLMLSTPDAVMQYLVENPEKVYISSWGEIAIVHDDEYCITLKIARDISVKGFSSSGNDKEESDDDKKSDDDEDEDEDEDEVFSITEEVLQKYPEFLHHLVIDGQSLINIIAHRDNAIVNKYSVDIKYVNRPDVDVEISI